MSQKSYWLMKSEPDVYSIQDLQKEGKAFWEGVRNYQARNFLRDQLQVGDMALFYHSNAKPPGVAGIARICRSGYPDFTAWDPTSPYFDTKSNPNEPRWFMVDVEFVELFPQIVSLDTLKKHPVLSKMLVCRRGQRLSIQPLEKEHFELVCQLGYAKL